MIRTSETWQALSFDNGCCLQLTFLGFAPRTSVVLEPVFGGLPIPHARISCSTSSNHGAPPCLSSRHFSTVEAVTPRPSHLRTARKLIMPVRLRLQEVATRSDLADALCVPVAAIGVLSLLGLTSCKTAGCPLPAVLGSQSRCLLCSQTRFPRELDRSGNPKRNRRGYGLFGPQFLRIHGSRTSPRLSAPARMPSARK